MNTNIKPTPFSSFIWSGFECTSALSRKIRLNLLKATRHDELVREDYRLIKKYGMTTVREGLSWSSIDKGDNVYDFEMFENMMKIGIEEKIQQIWDLNHFDYPQDLNALSDQFPIRFTQYALRAHEKLREYIKDILYIVPINEISFFAWIAADQGKWAPFLKGRQNGFHFKKNLVKSAISAMSAIKKTDKQVRFIQVDPYMRRMAKPPANKSAINHTKEFNEVIRYESWDMLAGMKYPELKGDPSFLDYIGINYYRHNQEWVISLGKDRIRHQAMSWQSPARISFAEMIKDLHKRYKAPIVITETGSYGGLRYKWWKRILGEVNLAIKAGIPIDGICAYPVLDRPDWAGFLLPRSGLWDFDQNNSLYPRIPHRHTLYLIKDYINGVSK